MIHSGPALVLASGSVIAFRGNPVTLIFGPGERKLKFEFSFVSEQTGEQSPLQVRLERPDDFTLRLTLVNFNDPLGAGTTVPKSVGVLQGRQLYIHYRVYHLEESADKLIHYTLYQGEEVRNG